MPTKQPPAPRVSPAVCITNLKEYHERLFLLLNILPRVIETLRDETLGMLARTAVADRLEENFKKVKEFHQ